jgi:hypothetical protein
MARFGGNKVIQGQVGKDTEYKIVYGIKGPFPEGKVAPPEEIIFDIGTVGLLHNNSIQ